MESSFGAMTYKSRKQALQFGGFFAEQMGCGDADAADALACMRNASSDAVKAAWVGLGGNAKKIAEMVIDWQNLAVALTFTPAVLETDEWPMQPNEAAAQGRIADIPMIIGYNAADAQLFVACSDKPIPLAEYKAGLFVAFGTHSFDISHLYPVHHEAGVPGGLNSIMTDFLFHCPSQRWANNSSSRSPQFLYMFNHSLPFNIYNKSCCDGKACHALEVPLIFNATGPLSLDASSERISAAMMKMWGDFAKTGQPTPAGDAWPAWNSVQQSVMNINQDSLTLSSDAGGTCDKLWNKWTVFWDVPAV